MYKSLFLLLTIPLYLFSFDYKKEKIIICGTAKNIAYYLPFMREKIETLGCCFSDYRVFIYENNSQDNTLTLLNQWSKDNQKVIITSEYLTQEQLYQRTRAHGIGSNIPCRMELIAYGRNKILDICFETPFDDFNFIIMTDLDFRKGWEIVDVLACFSLPIEWDCIAANGIRNNSYYDRYAFRDEQFPFGPELLGEEFWKGIHEYPITFTPESGLHQVYSAFGGIALYKKEALRHCRYSGIVTKDLEILVSHFLERLRPSTPDFAKATPDKSLRTSGLSNFQVKPNNHKRHSGLTKCLLFKANSGYDLPVVCEHVTLHASMILAGHDKIYVNPSLICRYN